MFLPSIFLLFLTVSAISLKSQKVQKLTYPAKFGNLTDFLIEANFYYCESKFLSKRDNENSSVWNVTEDVDDFLERYIGELKTYISVTGVDFSGFADVIGTLEMDLRMVKKLVAYDLVYNSELFTKFDTATQIFRTLRKALENLKSINSIDPQIKKLLHQLIEINVITVSLKTSHGLLNLETEGVLGKLLQLWNKLAFCIIQFKSLANVPVDTIFMFEDYLVDAKRALHSLAAQIPQSKKTHFFLVKM